jgi:SAM-dependent methyltransferase
VNDDGSGRAISAAMFAEVEPLFRGRGVAIEIGCGVGHVLLGHAQTFERLRGVDPRPELLAVLEQRAADAGIGNVRGFLPTQPWNEPTGSADYAYALRAFRHIEDPLALANYLQGMSSVLRRGGIVQLAFDTRPRDILHRAAAHLPQRLLAPEHRRGQRTVRHTEDWIRDRFRGADLQLIGERQAGSAEHWFIARRR